jgi:uncharacterized protein
MAVQFSSTQRAVAVGVISAGLLIGAFTLGAGQGSASPAAAGGTTRSASLTAATAPAQGGTRITVTGTGNVSGIPNQLQVSMGVQTNAGSVAAALRQANSAVRSITGVLTRSGVGAADVQTSGLSIYPQYSGSGAPRGYQVSEQLTITLRSLSTAGSQISAAARAGGNATVIDGVSLNLSDTSTLMAQARSKAVADARAKATAYARALGRPLGAVVSMSESPPAVPFQPVPEFAATPSASGASSVPVHPGTQQLSVTVTVIFSLG